MKSEKEETRDGNTWGNPPPVDGILKILLEELLSKQRKVGGLFFDFQVVHVIDIQKIFSKHGINLE